MQQIVIDLDVEDAPDHGPADSDSAYASKTPTHSASDLSEDELSSAISRKRTAAVVVDVRPAKQPRRDAPPLERDGGIAVHLPPMCHPKSAYDGWERPLPITKERDLLKEFTECTDSDEKLKSERKARRYYNYRLEGFCFYCPGVPKRPEELANLGGTRRAQELTMLSTLAVSGPAGKPYLLMDGILINENGDRRYVEGLRIHSVIVGNYFAVDEHDTNENMWVQSELSYSKKVFYELGKPTSEYERYYTPFVWLANFSKHFLDFVGDVPGDIVLQDFRSRFCEWLLQHHGDSPSFRAWHAEYGRDDFRTAVAVHEEWLWNQAYLMKRSNSGKNLRILTLWKEIHILEIIPKAPGISKQQYAYEERYDQDGNVRVVRTATREKTVVTPYVYECFKHIWPDGLRAVTPRPLLPKDTVQKFDRVEVPKPMRVPRDDDGRVIQPEMLDLKVGDVVALSPDNNTLWKTGGEIWYGYVQGIKEGKRPSLKLIWLYTPGHTILAGEWYPHHNELFFSDHCNCRAATTYADEVLYTVSTAFFAGPRESGAEFFVRQMYRTEDVTDPAFITLTKSMLDGCHCDRTPPTDFHAAKRKFAIGDTALARLKQNAKVLEPVEILKFDREEGMVKVRVMERRKRFEKSARPNELLYTPDTAVWIQPKKLKRHCQIKVLERGTKVPVPYDRDGAGDFYYITSQINPETGSIEPITATEKLSMKQGVDPTEPIPGRPRLNGLDLFCGGGNFGRGLEEGGAIQMKWAVDIACAPLHSYRANLADVNDTALYLGSINKYVEDAMLGKHSRTIASPEEVDFISAGSPCQGFSNANLKKDSDKSLANSSLVASVGTCVDYFRPRYALLENVHGIASKHKSRTGTFNVFQQLLNCVVGMGYQAEQWTLDAWSYGNPQLRTRLFLCLAAPGHPLPGRPPRSHQHPPDQRDRTLYEAPNGTQFGGREQGGSCPFDFVTAAEGFGDLPDIADAHVGACVPYPDHRTSRTESWNTRLLMAHVPHVPARMGWRAAVDSGRMPAPLQWYKPTKARTNPSCRSWQRILRDGLCRTITTSLTPACSFTGQWMHWAQDRLLTVMEARRAQGFPDDEVLVGRASDAFHVVGNSVARAVSLAWGLSVREAWLRGRPTESRRVGPVGVVMLKPEELEGGSEDEDETEDEAGDRDGEEEGEASVGMRIMQLRGDAGGDVTELDTEALGQELVEKEEEDEEEDSEGFNGTIRLVADTDMDGM